MKTKLLVAFCLLVTILPSVSAQIAGHGDSGQDCAQETLIGLLGVTSAGNIEACAYYPKTVVNSGSIFNADIKLTAPAATGAGTAGMTTTWTGTGCTLGTPTNGGPGGSGFGTQFYSEVTFTLTSQQCKGRALVDYKNGAGTSLFTVPFNFVVVAFDSTQVMEVQNRICAASALHAGAACNDLRVLTKDCNTADVFPACSNPTKNDVLSGSAIPDFVNQAFWTISLAIMLALALFLLQLHDPGAKILSGSIAALAGFMAFNTAGSLLFRAPFILACFATMAYAYFRAGNSLINDRDPLKDIGDV